jgi:hypothetical protein
MDLWNWISLLGAAAGLFAVLSLSISMILDLQSRKAGFQSKGVRRKSGLLRPIVRRHARSRPR